MATNLEQKLEQILEEKNTKIKPENLREGVTAFGVLGELKPLSITDDATATDEDIFFGKLAYGRNEKILGTMPNNGQLEFSPTREKQLIPAGYTSGGVVNEIETKELDIVPQEVPQVFEGVFTNINVLPIETQNLNITPTKEPQNYSGLYKEVNVAGENNLLPENIKKDVSIFGIIGTHEGGESSENEYNVLVEGDTLTTFNLALWVKEIKELDLSNVTNMNAAFSGMSYLTKLPSSLNTSKATNMGSMFKNCGSLENFPDMDTARVTTMHSMFYNCGKLKIPKLYNTAKVTIAQEMFYNCPLLEEVPEYDLSSCTSTYQMFYKCLALKSVKLLTTSKVTNWYGMLSYCDGLEEVELDCSSGGDFTNMFAYCKGSVTLTITLNNAANVKTVAAMFYENKQIREAPAFDTSNVTGFNSFFCYATRVKTIPAYDASKGTNFISAFGSCSALVNFGGFLNVGKGFTSKSNNVSSYAQTYSSATKLSHDSLMNIINGLYDLNLTYDVANGGTLYTQKLVLGSTNMAKLTSDEIAVATAKRLGGFIEGGKIDEVICLYKTKNDSSR